MSARGGNGSHYTVSTKSEAKAKVQKFLIDAHRKQQQLAIANHKCEHCGSLNQLSLHHETYVNLGNEDIHDLRILCQPCHSRLL
jgi:5-methylcytosine-specific restriction endonuclease McrA